MLDDWVGAPVVYATQVHGTDVVVLSEPAAVGEADALVSISSDAPVGVLVADCVPVLLADASAGVVAAVHAGRRGLASGVLQAAVAAMVGAGADVERIRAASGPAIGGRSYEVPAELRDEVADVVPETFATTSWGTPALDLPAGVVAVLRRLGVEDVLRLRPRHLHRRRPVLVPTLAADRQVRGSRARPRLTCRTRCRGTTARGRVAT